MRGRTILVVVGLVGTVWAVTGEGIALGAGRAPAAALLHLAIGLTYLFGGLAIWNHEPANRTGRLMTLVGLTWPIATLVGSGLPVLNELGLALEDTPTVLLVALVLAYPSGELESRLGRAAVVILAIGATALNTLQLTTVPLVLNEGINGLYGGLSLALMSAAVVVRRWFVAPARARRELLPVLIAGMVLLTTLVINIVRRIGTTPPDVAALLIAARDLAPAAIPIALLIGFYRQSEHRLKAMVDAIPDRMFRVHRDGRYIDGGAGRADDPAGPDVLIGQRLHGAIASAAGEAADRCVELALETGRLQAYDFALDLPSGRREFEARVMPSGPDEATVIVRDFTAQRATDAELRRSRARIVEATDYERRRLERDLHDGAQQRLVSLSLALRLLRSRLGSAGEPNEALVVAADDASAELKVAIKELRELARGIHPAILTEAGLGAAITTLAERSDVPTAVTSLPDQRFAPGVEAAAYFVVSEALANVTKYASASHASVRAEHIGSTLRVAVEDDGVGGADASRGTGIRGLQDRIAAVGGLLTIDSKVGAGTRIVAEIPTG